TGYDAANSTVGTVTTVTNQVSSDVTAISGDSVAADNAEAFFDNTGFTASNSTIGTATAVTNQVTANVTAISGDSTAADNAEACFYNRGFSACQSSIRSIGSLGIQAKADVNAEVVDVLTTDTRSQPSAGAAPANPTFDEMVSYLYMQLVRNKVVTNGTDGRVEVYADDGTTILYIQPYADDGT